MDLIGNQDDCAIALRCVADGKEEMHMLPEDQDELRGMPPGASAHGRTPVKHKRCEVDASMVDRDANTDGSLPWKRQKRDSAAAEELGAIDAESEGGDGMSSIEGTWDGRGKDGEESNEWEAQGTAKLGGECVSQVKTATQQGMRCRGDQHR